MLFTKNSLSILGTFTIILDCTDFGLIGLGPYSLDLGNFSQYGPTMFGK